MKQILITAFLLTATFSYAQTRDEKQILSILDNQTKNWNCGDLKSFMKGYWQNDSLMFIGKSGITYGYEQTLASYRKSYPDMDAMGELNFTIIKMTKLAGDAYFVVGKWHLKRDEKQGDLQGHYTLLFKKIKGQWVIVADHSS